MGHRRNLEAVLQHHQNANSAIEALEGYAQHCTTEAQQKANRAYIGEVKFMRAYAYFRLIQAFGTCTILRDNNQSDLRRSTTEAVYKYALEDLQYGMDNMPRIRPNQSEHKGAVTAFTAATLAAKIYLNQGNYQKVEELTDDIIAHGNFHLYPDYYQLWKIPGKLCDESIFECQCTDFGNGSGDMIDADQWFVLQGPSNSGSNISGWGAIGILKSFRDWAYGRGETVRATTSFLMADSTTPSGDYIKPQDNPAKTDCWNGKVYTPSNQLTPGRTKYGSNNNIRVLRYADVLLMNAEAKVKLGKTVMLPSMRFVVVLTCLSLLMLPSTRLLTSAAWSSAASGVSVTMTLCAQAKLLQSWSVGLRRRLLCRYLSTRPLPSLTC